MFIVIKMGFFDKKVGDMTIIEFVLYLFLIKHLLILLFCSAIATMFGEQQRKKKKAKSRS